MSYMELKLMAPVLALILALVPHGCLSAYTFEPGPVSAQDALHKPCPGLYCGRMPSSLLLDDVDMNKNLSGCGPCVRGWRVPPDLGLEGLPHVSVCLRCQSSLPLDAWLFLAFHALFVLVLHSMAIDRHRKKLNCTQMALHACAFLEVGLAAVAVLLLHEPIGSLDLISCDATRLSDWYSYLYNPTPNYTESLHCTQEIVWPLFTIVFVFHLLCVVFMVLFRPIVMSRVRMRRGNSWGAFFLALYFFPLLSLVHSFCAGLIYYAYPYIVLVLSVVSSAAHFAFKLDQSARSLVLGCFRNRRNLVVLVGHWLLHAFGIVAVTRVNDPGVHLPLLALVPLPAAFYVLTARFTDPNNFRQDPLAQ